MNDSHIDGLLVNIGGAVKALDDSGRFEGNAIVFGSPDVTDLSRFKDFFASDTDYGRAMKSGGLDLIYHHGLPFVGTEPNVLADRTLADVKVQADDARVWITGQMSLADAYEKHVFEAIKAGKIRLSTAADPNRIRRVRQDNGSHKVVAWHLIHVAATPMPADPKTSLHAIKSLAEFALLAGSAKYMDDAPGGPPNPGRIAAQAVVERLGSLLGMVVYRMIGDPDMAVAARSAAIRTAFDEHRDLIVRAVDALMTAPDSADLQAETKSLWLGALRSATANLRLTDHLDAARDVAEGLVGRLSSYAALKSADGHAIPPDRAAAIETFRTTLGALLVAGRPRSDSRVLKDLEQSFLALRARHGSA